MRLKEDKKGRAIRLDKQTGEIAVLEGDKLVTLKSPADQEPDKTSIDEALTEIRVTLPKTWPTIEIEQLGGLRATLRTSWRDDQLYYQFSLGPLLVQPPDFEKVQSDKLKPVTDPKIRFELEKMEKETLTELKKQEKDQLKALKAALLKNFTLLLYDQAGFKVVEIPFLKLTQTVDKKGEIMRLESNDSFTCSAEKYKNVSYWNLQWNP